MKLNIENKLLLPKFESLPHSCTLMCIPTSLQIMFVNILTIDKWLHLSAKPQLKPYFTKSQCWNSQRSHLSLHYPWIYTGFPNVRLGVKHHTPTWAWLMKLDLSLKKNMYWNYDTMEPSSKWVREIKNQIQFNTVITQTTLSYINTFWTCGGIHCNSLWRCGSSGNYRSHQSCSYTSRQNYSFFLATGEIWSHKF